MAMKLKKIKRAAVNAVRERGKKDLSPKWEGHEKWTAEEFTKNFRESISHYNLNFSPKDLKPKVLEWMTVEKIPKDKIKAFKDTADWRCNLTMGAIASCLLKGMPDQRKDFNQNKSAAVWLNGQIQKVIEEGRFDAHPTETAKGTAAPTPTIQDRLQEQAGRIAEKIDLAIDAWMQDPEGFDPKSFKLTGELRSVGAKAAHARFIKAFYETDHAELIELASGKADEQLREAYSRYPRKHIRKLIEFYELVKASCEQIAAEAKVLRKPRAKKVKSAEELTKKLKFKLSDDKLGISSAHPASIIGAQGVVVYNTKNRKIGMYVSKSSNGLSVKGSSIIDFTEKSYQKTLRKPDVQLREFKEQNTQKRVETWLSKIKATETKLNGRINGEIIILKVFK